MTMIPEKDVDLDEAKAIDLYHYLKEILEKPTPEKDLLAKVRQKIAQVDADYCRDIIQTMDGQTFDFVLTPYPLGDAYAALNRYDLIRDGFITVGGEASSGKTSFVTDLCLDILRHTPEACFLFYSLDDSVPMTGKRILSQLNGKSLFREKTDRLHMVPHIDLLKRIALRDSIDISKIDGEAERLKSITSCSKVIVGIDYLQVIPAPAGYAGDRRQLFNDNLRALKEKQVALQEAGGCILFCLSQMSRDTRVDGGYRYRETSEIENLSDVCIDLCLPRTEDEKLDRETDRRLIRVQKNKLGKRGTVFMTTITPFFTFTRLNYNRNEKEEDKTRRIDKKDRSFVGGLPL